MNMAKVTSKTSCGTVLLMIFMVFWVLLATTAKGEAPPARNEAKGNYIAERPIQDEDNTSKKMIGKITNPPIPTTKPPTQAYVYVIQEGENQVAKVGCTTNPKKRMSDLQGGNYRRLHYYLVIQLKESSNKYKLTAEKVAQKYLEDNKFATKLYWGGGTEWYDTTNSGIANVAENVKKILKEKSYFEDDVTQQVNAK